MIEGIGETVWPSRCLVSWQFVSAQGQAENQVEAQPMRSSSMTAQLPQLLRRQLAARQAFWADSRWWKTWHPQ